MRAGRRRLSAAKDRLVDPALPNGADEHTVWALRVRQPSVGPQAHRTPPCWLMGGSTLALGTSGRRTVGLTNRSTLLEGSLRHTSRNGTGPDLVADKVGVGREIIWLMVMIRRTLTA